MGLSQKTPEATRLVERLNLGVETGMSLVAGHLEGAQVLRLWGEMPKECYRNRAF